MDGSTPRQLLETSPLTILGFHSGYGPEYINKRGAELLENTLATYLATGGNRGDNDSFTPYPVNFAHVVVSEKRNT